MFSTFKSAWKIQDIKEKLLFTLFIILVYRLGTQILVPFVSTDIAASFNAAYGSSIFGYMNLLSGGSLSQASLFALSVSPYITASIVVQLLTVAIPALERWSKDGEEGKKKLNMLTRGCTLVLALVTAYGYMKLLDYGSGGESWLNLGNMSSGEKVFAKIVIVACFCAGASIIMWLAEKINDKGIGNGISMILFANIISRVPALLQNVWGLLFNSAGKFVWYGPILAILSLALTLAVIVLIVWFTNSERRIPIQYAKVTRGRKVYGGQASNLPLKMNMAGVMPIIFANSIVAIPATIAGFFPNSKFWTSVSDFFGMDTFIYLIAFLVLIVAFSYFYIMISFNPVEVANNIQSQGGSIRGIRSGRPTIEYIKKILKRVTTIGAVFICIIAGLPMLVTIINSMVGSTVFNGIAFGGSSLLIVVGVAIETQRDIEAQVAMRNIGGKAKGIFG